MLYTMGFTYNRAAFRAPILSPGAPCPALLGAYVSLVAIEIFLKEYLLLYVPKVPATHDVPKMLKMLATHVGAKHSGAFTSMSTQLSTRLANLWCAAKDGNPCAVPSANYPYMRYVRHSSDWGSSASNDSDINEVLVVSSQIIHTILKATGEKI